MKAVLQRVKKASVTINDTHTRSIEKGFVILLGITHTDTSKECDYLVEKIAGLRVFEDEEGKMNKSILDSQGNLLIVSQFTLYADCKKGKRPSFTNAAKPEIAIPLYERFVEEIKKLNLTVFTGEFGANMLVSLENDGPVTIILDTDEIMPKSK